MGDRNGSHFHTNKFPKLLKYIVQQLRRIPVIAVITLFNFRFFCLKTILDLICELHKKGKKYFNVEPHSMAVK